MSYAHYWSWETPRTGGDKFARWSRDVQTLLEQYPSYPNHCWEGLTPYPVPSNWSMNKICGPSGTGEPVIMKTEVAFNGDASADHHHDTFRISWEQLQEPNGFDGCCTSYNPYDLLVAAALIRLIYYFPDIHISSDGGAKGLHQGAQFCRGIFGIGVNPLG